MHVLPSEKASQLLRICFVKFNDTLDVTFTSEKYRSTFMYMALRDTSCLALLEVPVAKLPG